ncbi:MAG: hypothetical protein ACOYKZ_00335 [Chlamydiia bacterium]
MANVRRIQFGPNEFHRPEVHRPSAIHTTPLFGPDLPLRGILRRRAPNGELITPTPPSCGWRTSPKEQVSLRGDVWRVQSYQQELSYQLKQLQQPSAWTPNERVLVELPVWLALAMTLEETNRVGSEGREGTQFVRTFWLPYRQHRCGLVDVGQLKAMRALTENELWKTLEPALLDALGQFRAAIDGATRPWDAKVARVEPTWKEEFVKGLLSHEHLETAASWGVKVDCGEKLADWLHDWSKAPSSKRLDRLPAELRILMEQAPDRLQGALLCRVWDLKPRDLAVERVVSLTLGLGEALARVGSAVSVTRTLAALSHLKEQLQLPANIGTSTVVEGEIEKAPLCSLISEESARIALDLVEWYQTRGGWLEAQAVLMQLGGGQLPTHSGSFSDLWECIGSIDSMEESSAHRGRWQELMARQLGPVQLHVTAGCSSDRSQWGASLGNPWNHRVVWRNMTAVWHALQPPAVVQLTATPSLDMTEPAQVTGSGRAGNSVFQPAVQESESVRAAVFRHAFRSASDPQRAAMLDHLEPCAAQWKPLKDCLEREARRFLLDRTTALLPAWERSWWVGIAPSLKRLFIEVLSAFDGTSKGASRAWKDPFGKIWHRVTPWFTAVEQMLKVSDRLSREGAREYDQGKIHQVAHLLECSLAVLVPVIERSQEEVDAAFRDMQLWAEWCYPEALDLEFRGRALDWLIEIKEAFDPAQPSEGTVVPGELLALLNQTKSEQRTALKQCWRECEPCIMGALQSWGRWVLALRRTGVTTQDRSATVVDCAEKARMALEGALKSLSELLLNDVLTERAVSADFEPIRAGLTGLVACITKMQGRREALMRRVDAEGLQVASEGMEPFQKVWRRGFFKSYLAGAGHAVQALRLLCLDKHGHTKLGPMDIEEMTELLMSWLEHCLPDAAVEASAEVASEGRQMLKWLLAGENIEIRTGSSGLITIGQFRGIDLYATGHSQQLVRLILNDLGGFVKGVKAAKAIFDDAAATDKQRKREYHNISSEDVIVPRDMPQDQRDRFVVGRVRDDRRAKKVECQLARDGKRRARDGLRETCRLVARHYFDYVNAMRAGVRGGAEAEFIRELHRVLLDVLFDREMVEALKACDGEGPAQTGQLEDFKRLLKEGKRPLIATERPDVQLKNLLDQHQQGPSGQMGSWAIANLASELVSELLNWFGRKAIAPEGSTAGVGTSSSHATAPLATDMEALSPEQAQLIRRGMVLSLNTQAYCVRQLWRAWDWAGQQNPSDTELVNELEDKLQARSEDLADNLLSSWKRVPVTEGEAKQAVLNEMLRSLRGELLPERRERPGELPPLCKPVIKEIELALQYRRLDTPSIDEALFQEILKLNQELLAQEERRPAERS